MSSRERATIRRARIAGLLYLAIIIFGVASEGLVRSSLIVAGDATQTAANILASNGLFRMSFVADTIMVLCDVALAVLLFLLLEPVSRSLAMMGAAFRLAQAAVLGTNLLNQHVALLLLTSNGSGALEPSARDALALLFVEAQGYGYDLGLVFFGINCLLTGYLIFESGFLPRTLGVLIATSGVVYLVGSYLRFLAPGAAEAFQVAYALPLIAETAFCAWLLVKGVNGEKWIARVESQPT